VKETSRSPGIFYCARPALVEPSEIRREALKKKNIGRKWEKGHAVKQSETNK
jgi:hypothetical protein